ncbi:MAG TPA: hypothetical protein EYH19_03190 [Desulfocapsa sulfexigens]|nr:hypothetical protein [Desulfocapsa sulfexigens]
MRKSHNTVIVGAELSLAWFLLQQNPYNRILLIKKQKLADRAIKTYHYQGFLVEKGPHGFLDNCQADRELLKGTHLEDLIHVSEKQSFCVNHSRKWMPDENQL